MNPKELVEWLDEQDDTVRRSYGETDGVVRDARALNDLRAIEGLKRLLERHDARTAALSECRDYIHDHEHFAGYDSVGGERISPCPGPDECDEARLLELAEKALGEVSS